MPVAVSDSCFRISFGAGHRACLGGNSLTAVSLLWFAPIGRTCDCLDRVAEISVYIRAHFRVEIRGHEENSPDRSGELFNYAPVGGDEEQKGNQFPLGIAIINHSEE
jgi:hypothetical protein